MPLAPERVIEAGRAFARVQREVIIGQLIDLRGAPASAEQVESMHDLKTGSYTVRGPLAIGAILAGASAEQRAALDRFAAPLGVAFQLRDDLLGTFGDPRATGKPAGNDVRRGKRTALVAALAEDAGGAPPHEARVRGRQTPATRTSRRSSREWMRAARGARRSASARAPRAGGARARVGAARRASGRSWLQGAVKALGERDS